MRASAAIGRWWARYSLGRDDGVSPHRFEADASGPGDVEGVWWSEAPGEALAHRTVCRVTLRYPFRPRFIAMLEHFDFLERVTFDAEGAEHAAQALMDVRVPLPKHRDFEVWACRYVGSEKPAFLAQARAKRIRWFDCPHIEGSELQPAPVF